MKPPQGLIDTCKRDGYDVSGIGRIWDACWKKHYDPVTGPSEVQGKVWMQTYDIIRKRHQQAVKQTAHVPMEWDYEDITSNFLDAKDVFTGEVPPRDWLVENLLENGTYIMVIGDAKGGKTWIIMHIAEKILIGGKVFDKFQAREGCVLLVDEESGRERVKKRMQQLKTHDWHEGYNQLYVLSKMGLAIDNANPNLNYEREEDDKEKLRAALRHIRQEHPGKPIYVIFDSLSGVALADDSSNRDMKYLRRIIGDLQTEFLDTQFTMIHHTNRGGQMRGASDFTAQVDATWNIGVPKEKGNKEKDDARKDNQKLNYTVLSTGVNRDGTGFSEIEIQFKDLEEKVGAKQEFNKVRLIAFTGEKNANPFHDMTEKEEAYARLKKWCEEGNTAEVGKWYPTKYFVGILNNQMKKKWNSSNNYFQNARDKLVEEGYLEKAHGKMKVLKAAKKTSDSTKTTE